MSSTPYQPRHIRESLEILQQELFSEKQMQRLEKARQEHPSRKSIELASGEGFRLVWEERKP